MKSNNNQKKQNNQLLNEGFAQRKNNGAAITDNRPSQLYQANLMQSIQRQTLRNASNPMQLKKGDKPKEKGENEYTNIGKGAKGVLSGLKGYDKMMAGKSNTATSLGGALGLAASPLQVGGNILSGFNEKSKAGKRLGNTGGMLGAMGKTLGSAGKLGKDGNSELEDLSAYSNTLSGGLNTVNKGMKLFGGSKKKMNDLSASSSIFGFAGDTADIANDSINFHKDWKEGKYKDDHFKKVRAGVKGAQNAASWTKSYFSTVENIAKAAKASEASIASITQITSVVGLVSDSIGLVYNVFQIAKHLNNANTIKEKMTLMDVNIDRLLTNKITLQQAASRLPHLKNQLKNFYDQKSILESIFVEAQQEPSGLVKNEKISKEIMTLISTIETQQGEINAIQQGEGAIEKINEEIPQLVDRKISLQKIHKLQLKKGADSSVDTAMNAACVVGSSLTLSGAGAVPGLAIGAAVGGAKIAQWGVKKYKRNQRDAIDEGFKRSKIVKKSEKLEGLTGELEGGLALDEYIANRIPYYMDLVEKYGKVNKKGRIEAPLLKDIFSQLLSPIADSCDHNSPLLT